MSDTALANTPQEAFDTILRSNQFLIVGGRKITRLEAEHLEPRYFKEKYGFSPLVNFFNSLGDFICDSNGRIVIEEDKENRHVLDWYKRASKYIRIHFQKGVSDYKKS